MGIVRALFLMSLGWQAQQVALFHAFRTLNPLAIEAHLAGSEPLLDRTKTGARRNGFNEPVEPLPVLIRIDGDFNGQGSVPPNIQQRNLPA